jgi:hypothetical protein
MACSSGNISNLIKSTKIVQQPTSRQITIGFAEVVDNTADALEDAIAATGVSIGDTAPTDNNCLAQSYECGSYEAKAETVCEVVWVFIGFDFYGSTQQASGGSAIADGTNLNFAYGSALDNDQTNADINSPTTPLLVYWWRNPALINTAGNNATDKEGCTVNVLKPYTTLTVSYFYITDGFPDDSIAALQATVGHTNNAIWQAGAVNTWVVFNVAVNPVGLPNQLRIDITFVYHPQTWTAWAFYKDKTTGGSPEPCLKNIADPTQNVATTGSNACRGFQVYTSIGFASILGF